MNEFAAFRLKVSPGNAFLNQSIRDYIKTDPAKKTTNKEKITTELVCVCVCVCVGETENNSGGKNNNSRVVKYDDHTP